MMHMIRSQFYPVCRRRRPSVTGASSTRCLRGLRTPPPGDCKMNVCTTPKAENGQPTVKCREYLIFKPRDAPKTHFPVASPGPHGASLQHSLRSLSWWGGGLLPLPKNPTPPPLSALGAQTSAFRASFHTAAIWLDPPNH